MTIQAFAKDGFGVVEHVLSAEQVQTLLTALEQVNVEATLQRSGGVFAVRNLLDVPAIRQLAESAAVRALVEPVLGPACFAVRGILFDKVPEANWKVPWHQDVTIAVEKRFEADGFGPWTMKAGVLHVQPPVSVLEAMMSVRLHLDPCGAENGPLRVLPGSHVFGRFTDGEISRVREATREHVCEVAVGGALLMRPLLLHASSPSSSPAHRRVIHLDFASMDLPQGLRWQARSAVAA